ncbi:unnamed protein product, partial [marine sediment metagenome]
LSDNNESVTAEDKPSVTSASWSVKVKGLAQPRQSHLLV